MVCMLDCLVCGSRLSGLHDGSAAAGRQGGAAAPWAMTGSYPVRVIFHAQLDNSQAMSSTQKRKFDFVSDVETKCPGGPGICLQGSARPMGRDRWGVF